MNSQSNGFNNTQQDDDTKFRIIGDKNFPITKTENYQYQFIIINKLWQRLQ